jgi:hypothetical protein
MADGGCVAAASRINVLVSHETSGVTREAFRRRGFNAWSCDLLPAQDGSPFHIQADALTVYDRGWHLLIAHPDCTYLCASGLHWNKRGRMVDGRPRAELTEEALAHVRAVLAAPIEHIALENSRGCIGTRIRPYDQSIHPFQFGHDASKTTDLWLKNLPPLTLDPAQFVPPRMVCKACKGVSPYERAFGQGCIHCGAEAGMLLPRWGNQTDSGQNRLPPSDNRWQLRADTYPGIAAAFAQQWGDFLLAKLAA